VELNCRKALGRDRDNCSGGPVSYGTAGIKQSVYGQGVGDRLTDFSAGSRDMLISNNLIVLNYLMLTALQ
jgi:hypothetical protein